jgi:hypothetical protein
VAVIVATQAHHPQPRPGPPPHAAAPASVKVIRKLSIDGRTVPQTAARQSLRAMIGERAHATGITVESVVSHNGFWVGTARARLWVQLTGPLQPLRIRPGDRVRFTGTVVGNKPSYPGRAGVSRRDGAGLLESQGAHLNVRTTRISVRHQR